ncbi:MAG: nuclear transport factor 2 family protein [Pyrinomonadaceae bacterium]
MRKTGLLTIAALAAFMMGCGGVAENKPANTPANTATKTAAAPAVEALFDMEKKANEAWIKGDKAYFEGMLSDKFVSMEQGKRMGKSDVTGMIGSFKCDVKSWNLEDPKMSKINDDTYAMSYKGTFDGSCTGPDGKAMKLPSPVRSASVWVRDGDKWKGAFHGETPIIDPKNPPAPPAKEEAKKDEPKADDKMADKKDDKPAAGNSNAAASAPAKPTPSANTDALMKLHQGGWDAWKNKDAKYFDTMLTSSFAFVDPIGGYTGSKADAIKIWTEAKCEGVTKATITDGFASAISPTVELLTLKGTADGSCDGQKNGPLNQAAVYVKEGEAWKLAFMFESPAM